MIKIYEEVVQGTDEWYALRLGLTTASEVKKLITPTGKIADNDDTRSHVYELLAQRITGRIDPSYISDDMLRGKIEEMDALALYDEKYDKIKKVGFITNDKWGFTIGYSPDALVGDDGLIEVKSHRQKYQIETILSDGLPTNKALNPMLQIQTGLLVSERKWCDFVSYSGGLPMNVVRVYPDEEIQKNIVQAVKATEDKIAKLTELYNAKIKNLFPTEYRELDMEIKL